METVEFFARSGSEIGYSREVAEEILSGLRQVSDYSQLAEHLVMYYDKLAEWESPNKKDILMKLINAIREAANADLDLETVQRILMIVGFTYLAFPDESGKDAANRILSIVKEGSPHFTSAGLIKNLNRIADNDQKTKCPKD